MLPNNLKKVDSSSKEAKVLIRNTFLNLHKKNRVLDLYQGVDKVMFKSVYENNPNVEFYKGYDIKSVDLESRLDNRKAIFAENLDDYNFFDLDAYGSPYELFFNIIIRIEKKGRKSFIVTDSLFLNNHCSTSTTLQKACLNIPRKFHIPCFHRHHNFFLSRLFKKVEEKTGFKVLKMKRAFVNATKINYFGFELQK